MALLAALPLAGCAHTDLKAPCKADEGALSYAEVPHDCGPMRRLNAVFAPLDRAAGAGPQAEPLR